MTLKVVIRDASGALINIGPWDYQRSHQPTGRLIMVGVDDGSGGVIFTQETAEVELNPLPEGAYEAEADIVTGWDGGLYEASDPRRLGPNQ